MVIEFVECDLLIEVILFLIMFVKNCYNNVEINDVW